MASGYPDIPGPIYSIVDHEISWQSVNGEEVLGSASRVPLESWTYTGNYLISDTGSSTPGIIFLVFPEPITWYGAALSARMSGNATNVTNMFLQYSTDSLDGITGNWTTAISYPGPNGDWASVGASRHALRGSVVSPSEGPIEGVTCLRMTYSQQNFSSKTINLRNFIIFGHAVGGAGGLQFWDSIEDEPLAYDAFDYDPINVDGSSPITEFRVHNPGDSYSESIEITSVQEPSTVNLEVLFSKDEGGTWADAVELDPVPPQGESPVIYAQVNSDTDYLGLSTFKVRILPAS